MNALDQRVAQSTHKYAGTELDEKEPDLFGQPCCDAKVILTYHHLDEKLPPADAPNAEHLIALERSLYPIAECPACGATWETTPLVSYEMFTIAPDELHRLRVLVGILPHAGAPISDPSHYGMIEVD